MTDQRDGGIAWTDETWNPIRGCSEAGPDCAGCYARDFAAIRMSGPGQAYEGLARRSPGRGLPQWTGQVRWVPSRLGDPLRWTRPRRVFVNSMSDLFHERLSNAQIGTIFAVMAASPLHTFQVLTKRAQRMADWYGWLAKMAEGRGYAHALRACVAALHAADVPADVARRLSERADVLDGIPWPLENVWPGVSCGDQVTADERLPYLRAVPAEVRWVSYEPAFGPLNLCAVGPYDMLRGAAPLHWVVVGGESGTRARPFDLAWADQIVRDCRSAGAACFVKQLGRRPYDSTDGHGGEVHLRDDAGADVSEWPARLRVRELPEAA